MNLQAETEFDIEGEDVFAVERQYKPKITFFWKTVQYEREVTIIGFYDKNNGKSKEYHLDCSIEKHNDFVYRLRAKLNKVNSHHE